MVIGKYVGKSTRMERASRNLPKVSFTQAIKEYIGLTTDSTVRTRMYNFDGTNLLDKLKKHFNEKTIRTDMIRIRIHNIPYIVIVAGNGFTITEDY